MGPGRHRHFDVSEIIMLDGADGGSVQQDTKRKQPDEHANEDAKRARHQHEGLSRDGADAAASPTMDGETRQRVVYDYDM